MRFGKITEVAQTPSLARRQKIEAGAAALLRPGSSGRYSSRQRLHEVLANRGFQGVVLEGNWGVQIRLKDSFHLRIHLALIVLSIQLLSPESDGDHLFCLFFRREGQDLQKSRLLVQDRQYL